MIFQILWKKWKIELAEPCTDRLCVLVIKVFTNFFDIMNGLYDFKGWGKQHWAEPFF